MNRTTFLAATGGALAMAAVPHAARATESDIALHTPTGTIFGTLALPPSAMPCPVVLIIAGFGCAGERRHCIRRYDKRGVGASASALQSESDVRFTTYVDDAAAWVKMLAADKRFPSVAHRRAQ